MYFFREKIEYTLPFYPIFLCGSKYKSEDDLNDKRNVLRSYMHTPLKMRSQTGEIEHGFRRD